MGTQYVFLFVAASLWQTVKNGNIVPELNRPHETISSRKSYDSIHCFVYYKESLSCTINQIKVQDINAIYNITALYKEWMVKEDIKVPVRQ